ncbi:phosphate-selective porin OprO/OprP [Nitrosomonas sp. Nm84]|uniref:OprO/OprP family phosphate-selective porin n=1 Tax=Nitrosomonas sp. Nm84 TaxID=200124 RepID=UPI000D7596DC|nr:porin [Nitrosomonas sp. Nm84]PXW89698.1 phosphate-selective porin OprO/OprP [Nitrosomonas sp. Nm84]
MKVFWLKIVLCATICSFFINTAAYAQEDIPDRSQKSTIKKSSKDKKRQKRKSGFFYGNAGSGLRWNKGESEIRLSGFIQADTRTYFEDSAEFGKDNFLLRRIQPSLEVEFNKTYSLYIMSNFTSTPGILDVYLEGNFTKPFNVRVGKFKPPFGLERLQSATALAFNERAFPTNLAPNREVGAQIFGNLLGDTTEYQIGLFSGAIDNSSGLRGNVIYANHSGIDFVARIFSHPLKHSNAEFLQGLGLGVAYSYGTQQGSAQPGGHNLPAFISPGQQLIASYVSGAFADGSRERIGPQLYYHYGPFGILGEYTVSQQNIKIGTATDKVTNDAAQVQLSWVLFNGDASFRRIRPNNPLTLENISALGAVQLVTRYSELNLDSNAFAHGLLNPDQSVKKAQDFGIGINWYLNRNVKFQLDYNQTHFTNGANGGTDRPEERVLFSRMQVAF